MSNPIYTWTEDLMAGAVQVEKAVSDLHNSQKELVEKSALIWHYSAELLSTLLSRFDDHLGVMVAQTMLTSAFEAISIKNTAVAMKEAYLENRFGEAIALGAMIPLMTANKIRSELSFYKAKSAQRETDAIRKEIERYSI